MATLLFRMRLQKESGKYESFRVLQLGMIKFKLVLLFAILQSELIKSVAGSLSADIDEDGTVRVVQIDNAQYHHHHQLHKSSHEDGVSSVESSWSRGGHNPYSRNANVPVNNRKTSAIVSFSNANDPTGTATPTAIVTNCTTYLESVKDKPAPLNTFELFKRLSHPCVYDKFTSPVHGFNPAEADLVNVRMHVYYLRQKSSKDFSVELCLLVELRWIDPRLEYASWYLNRTRNMTDPSIDRNDSSFTTGSTESELPISAIHGDQTFLKPLWIPQLYLASVREPLIRGVQNKETSVAILPDGTVILTSRIITEVPCWVKLGKFPLDRQKCHMSIDTWKFHSDELQLRWDHNSSVSWSKEASFVAEYTITEAVHISNYDFAEPDDIAAPFFNCSSLRLVFYVARNQGFYFMDYYLPSILIVVVSWVTFWEAPDAVPGRCLLGTGTLLTFIALGVDVSRSLPVVPYIRANDLWFIGCTSFIFLALAEFAFVNTLWRYGGEAELKKPTGKYILKSGLAVAKAPNVRRRPRRRSLSWSSTPTSRWPSPFKRVVDNELTVKSMSDLEISLPMSELKTMNSGAAVSFNIPPKEEDEYQEEEQPKPKSHHTKMTYNDMAIWIDKRSRIVFPVAFIVFNCVYWGLLLIPV